MLIYFAPENGKVFFCFSEILRIDPRELFLLAQGLVHGEESLGILALCFVHGSQFVAERGYLGFKRGDVCRTDWVAGGKLKTRQITATNLLFA